MDKIKILVVDDESRMRKLVKDFLGREGYQVLEAGDGMEAMEVFYDEKDIALIILDVMMPRMDGWQVCREVRQSSKVPIIMLTARSEERDELQGFALGVDEYISKPFSFELLCIRIKKLIEQQENRKMLFHKTIEITPSSITTTSLDEELVRKALHFVEENIDNPEYSIEDLSKDLGLSKTHLNRKLQSIVDLTPLQFIRSIRLKRAAQLLTNSQYNINEISYMVGFNTLKYFNSHFKEEFQMTPSQYREKNKG